MEHYEKKVSFLGENIQTIRKHRGMKQQELADKIGINMQSLSKIERGVNYPTFDTLEKIMDVLGVTPNELLSGEWKYVNQAEKEVCHRASSHVDLLPKVALRGIGHKRRVAGEVKHTSSPC